MAKGEVENTCSHCANPHTLTQVAVHVAKAVAQKAYENGYATALPKPHNLYDAARAAMYNPRYRRYR